MPQRPSYEELEKRINELEEILCAEIPSKTQEYLQKVLDCSPSAVYTKDLNGRYQFINNKFEDLSGFKKKDIISKTDFELFPESVAQNSTKDDRRVIETGTMLEIEELAPVEDRMHTFNTKKSPLINEDDGKIYEICGVSTDITKRKLAEEALRVSEEKHRLFFENSPIGISHYDNQGLITDINDAMVKILGSSREKLIGLDINDIPNKKFRNEIYKSLDGEIGYYEGEYISYTGSKTSTIKAIGVPLSSDGSAIGCVGIIEDITERKNLETELKKREERFKKIINGSIDGFAITNMNGKIIEVNKAYCQLLGYTQNEILNMSLIDLEAAMTKEELNNKTLKIIETGGSRFETKNKNKNGNIIDVEVSVSFTPKSNGTFLVFIRDITDRKNSEKALINLNKKLDSKVKKRTDELKRLNEHLILAEDSERKSLASELHDSVAQSLAMAISQIKDIKESDFGHAVEALPNVQRNIEMAIKEVRILIHQLHPQVLEDFAIDTALGYLIETINKKKQLRIHYINNIAESVSLIETTKVIIYRAITELINNILKHSGSSTAEIELSKINNNIRIRVEDKGTGFEINAHKQKNYCGFGLFSLSERIENMGGDLIINSSLGKGTKVILIVPINI